jgi:hypothetical protein
VQNQTGGAVDCVDGYMQLKNNIIMHNKGRSSIRYSNRFTYFNSSIVENNIIRENENKMMIETFGGQDVLIQNNNIDEDVLNKGNVNEIVTFEDDAEKIKIKNMNFDEKLYQTIIEVEKGYIEKSLSGRVARINDFWSVIAKVEGNRINVWGDATVNNLSNSELIIISSYTINK